MLLNMIFLIIFLCIIFVFCNFALADNSLQIKRIVFLTKNGN